MTLQKIFFARKICHCMVTSKTILTIQNYCENMWQFNYSITWDPGGQSCSLIYSEAMNGSECSQINMYLPSRLPIPSSFIILYVWILIIISAWSMRSGSLPWMLWILMWKLTTCCRSDLIVEKLHQMQLRTCRYGGGGIVVYCLSGKSVQVCLFTYCMYMHVVIGLRDG